MNELNKCKFCYIYKYNKKQIIFESNTIFVIKDIKPKYKNHILIISIKHTKDLKTLYETQDIIEFNNYFINLLQYIKIKNIKNFKIISNTGNFQNILHLHTHIYFD